MSFPQIDTSPSCKGCIEEGKRNRPAKHDHTIGCRFGRCQCDEINLDDSLKQEVDAEQVDKAVFDFHFDDTVTPPASPAPNHEEQPDSEEENFIDQEDVPDIFDFDTLIMDEAQDFSEKFWIFFETLVESKSARWILCYDVNQNISHKQAIY